MLPRHISTVSDTRYGRADQLRLQEDDSSHAPLRHVRRCDEAVIASSQRPSSGGFGTGSLSQPDVSIVAPVAARSSPMSEA